MTTPEEREFPSQEAVPGPGGTFEPPDEQPDIEPPPPPVPEEDDERDRRELERERREEDEAP